jgi:hypothetical protein
MAAPAPTVCRSGALSQVLRNKYVDWFLLTRALRNARLIVEPPIDQRRRTMPDYESDQGVLAQLASEFPAVPARVIAAVLAAFLATTPNLATAVVAAHDRLIDACAT